jgi:hypothetical protein
MKVIALVLGLCVLAGCSAQVGDPIVAAPAHNQGDDPATPAWCDANAYGECYPSADRGYGARTEKAWGSRLPNFAFYGQRAGTAPRVDAEGTPELGRITLSDYFDPKARTHDLLVIGLHAVWCGVSHNLAARVRDWAASKPDVAVLDLLIEGPDYGPATPRDILPWSNNTVGPTADTGLGMWAEVGSFMTTFAYPVLLIVDARSMELLDRTIGDGTVITDRLGEWRDAVQTRPPRP